MDNLKKLCIVALVFSVGILTARDQVQPDAFFDEDGAPFGEKFESFDGKTIDVPDEMNEPEQELGEEMESDDDEPETSRRIFMERPYFPPAQQAIIHKDLYEVGEKIEAAFEEFKELQRSIGMMPKTITEKDLRELEISKDPVISLFTSYEGTLAIECGTNIKETVKTLLPFIGNFIKRHKDSPRDLIPVLKTEITKLVHAIRVAEEKTIADMPVMMPEKEEMMPLEKEMVPQEMPEQITEEEPAEPMKAEVIEEEKEKPEEKVAEEALEEPIPAAEEIAPMAEEAEPAKKEGVAEEEEVAPAELPVEEEPAEAVEEPVEEAAPTEEEGVAEEEVAPEEPAPAEEEGVAEEEMAPDELPAELPVEEEPAVKTTPKKAVVEKAAEEEVTPTDEDELEAEAAIQALLATQEKIGAEEPDYGDELEDDEGLEEEEPSTES